MKGGGTLALLVALAVIAGVVLATTRGKAPTDDPSPSAGRPAAEVAVEEALGLPFSSPPQLESVPPDVLIAEVNAFLDGRFGPGGLTRRTRAYELLGLLPPGLNLRDQFLAMETAGARGWFNARTGRILVPAGFDRDNIHDRAALHGLLARLLVHQHTPMTIGTLPDDEWIARRALHQAVAESIEAKLRAEHPAAFAVPTAQQTERSATIASLALPLHQIANLPLEGGAARVFLETRVATGARALAELIREPPRSTFELLGGDPSDVVPPRVPPLGEVLFEESLGAFLVQALLEFVDDYEQARTLALLWRGDHYRHFADQAGDHLLWVCRWHTPEAATRAGEILARAVRPDEETPRAFSVAVHGRLTVFANCANETMLDEIKQHAWDESERSE